MLVAWTRSDRLIGLMVALSGVAVGFGTFGDFLAQRGQFANWWTVSGVVIAAVLVALAGAGMFLPETFLRSLWFGIPVLFLLVLLLCGAAWRQDGSLPPPWVWRFDTPLLALFALVARPAVTFLLAGLLAASPSLSALIFLGTVPLPVQEQSWVHVGTVAFIAILLNLRYQLQQLAKAEADAWGTQNDRAVAQVSAEEFEEFALVTHDEVLSTLAATTRFAGDPPPALRDGARRAIDALATSRTVPRIAPSTGLTAEEAAALLSRLIRQAEPEQYVEIASIVGDHFPERAIAATGLAAAEAVRNAVTHAHDVSVRVRVDGTGAEVVVSDRGTGFRVHAIDERRFGVRRSILARMQLLEGGAVSIRSGAAGTQVVLSWRR